MEGKENFISILEDFKRLEEKNLEVFLLLNGKDFEDISKILISWRKIKIEYKGTGLEIPEDLEGRWAWLWKNIKWDKRKLEKLTMLDSSRLSRIVEFLISNRIIFPDGTIHKSASLLLRAKIKEIIRKIPTDKDKSKNRKGFVDG